MFHIADVPPGCQVPPKSGGKDEKVTEYKDIVSMTILCQLWHIADTIFKSLDAVSLLQCEKVCDLWKQYLIRHRVWQKAVEKFANRFPAYVRQVGWWKHLPSFGGEQTLDLLVYQHTLWKMTNLNNNWSSSARSPTEQKKLFHRSGPINWKLLPSGRAVSVYGSGKGFILKIHDNLGFKFRSSHFNGAGTVKNDTLCMDATESKIVVAGYTSQKVWVFCMEEEDTSSLTMVPDFLVKMSQLTRPRTKNLVTKLTKFIAATGGVTKVQMHSDNERLAVLLPHSQSVEIWNIQLVTRLHRFVLTPDASFLIWKKDTLISAPLYSGVVQVFNTNTYEEKQSLVGFFRKIDAVSAFENLAVTAETRTIRLWKLSTCSTLASWEATKTYISALYMNDTMVVSGSGAGIVKIWDLPSLLQMQAGSPVTPLRKINMKGILHYPVKEISQCTYTDLVIIAKYEGKKKKDKVKIVEVKWN
jgi:WD40 repeat protein